MTMAEANPGDPLAHPKELPQEMVGGGSVPEPENPLKALERQLQCSLKVKGNTVTDAGGWGIGIMRPDGTIEVFVWGGE